MKMEVDKNAEARERRGGRGRGRRRAEEEGKEGDNEVTKNASRDSVHPYAKH